jgi:hypothetical protein
MLSIRAKTLGTGISAVGALNPVFLAIQASVGGLDCKERWLNLGELFWEDAGRNLN